MACGELSSPIVLCQNCSIWIQRKECVTRLCSKKKLIEWSQVLWACQTQRVPTCTPVNICILFFLVSLILLFGKVNKPQVRHQGLQCSPYQAVTSKIYCLKQNFLLPTTTRRFTKINESRFKKRKLWSSLILTAQRKWIK